MKASRFDSFGMIIPESDLQRIDYLEILVGEVFCCAPDCPKKEVNQKGPTGPRTQKVNPRRNRSLLKAKAQPVFFSVEE
jgi:hypothetical protein